ncbi:unnamed protein product, partial [Closterium sp. NIES-54]
VPLGRAAAERPYRFPLPLLPLSSLQAMIVALGAVGGSVSLGRATAGRFCRSLRPSSPLLPAGNDSGAGPGAGGAMVGIVPLGRVTAGRIFDCRDFSKALPLLPAGHDSGAGRAAAALTFRAVHSRTAAVHRILRRACCLFLLGLFLEGGFLHRTGDLSFGISLTRMRVCGTLQRIVVAYTVVALAQVLLSAPKDCHTEGYGEGLSGLLSFSLLTWQASLMLAAIYLALTFLLFVPDWTFTPPTSSASLSAVSSTFFPHAASAVSSTSQDLL